MKKKYKQLVHTPRNALGEWKQRVLLLGTLKKEIERCLLVHQKAPELIIGTDSQRYDTKYRYTSSLILRCTNELRNVLTKIYYMRMDYLPKEIPTDIDAFEAFTTKCLLKEWKITLALTSELYEMMVASSLPVSITAHFDYQSADQLQSVSAQYSGSYKAFQAVQAYIEQIDLPGEIHTIYKPYAHGATKASDRLLRAGGR